MNPIPKTVANSKIPPLPLTKHGPELDVWEPPFERWLRLADWLLANNASPGENTLPRKVVASDRSDFPFRRKC